MSKYIKLEDAEKLLTNALRVAQGFDEPLEKSLVDLPTIEVSEGDCENCIWDICNYNTLDWEVSEDCISREYLKSFEYINKGDFNSVETIREWIDNAPSVVPSRAKGEWIYIDEPIVGNPYGRYRCSECEMDKPHKTDYCPNCGAKMKGANNE